jgi:hypothetical protein
VQRGKAARMPKANRLRAARLGLAAATSGAVSFS